MVSKMAERGNRGDGRVRMYGRGLYFPLQGNRDRVLAG